MGLFLLSFTALCCYIFYKIAKILPYLYNQHRCLEKLPGPPRDNIILGHTSVMKLQPEDTPGWFLKLYKTYGGIFKLYNAWIPLVFISDADLAEAYLTDKNLLAKGDGYRALHIWLGLGLLTSQGQVWQQRRKLITPAFHFSILNDFCEIFTNNTLILIDQLRQRQDGTSVDVFRLMHLISLDNICETAMGIKIDALTNPKGDYIRALEDAAYAIIKRGRRPWYRNDFILSLAPFGRKLMKDLDIIFELSNKVIRNKINERSQKKEAADTSEIEDFEGKKKLAFLDLLLEASESQSVPLSDKDLRDEVNTFMFEGHDTTASAMSFAIYLLGLHPEVQEKCYQELDDIFQGSDRRPTAEDLRKMTYLEQVIKESLRLYPSVPMISRKLEEDKQFGKYTIPEGTTIILSIYNMHRDERYFPDPEKFDPDRFSAQNCASRHNFAFVPFAAGARNCIGQKYAMMEIKVVLSYIIRYFTFESSYGRDELQTLFTLVIRSVKSLDVKFKPRNFQS